MSIVEVTTSQEDQKVQAQLLRAPVNKKGEILADISSYAPTPATADMRALILKHFVLGTTTMQTPRLEFNDLSVYTRDQFDQMNFNTYQPNNGESNTLSVNSWRSQAIRPVVRNKCVSIAAHATARLIFPKIFAYNNSNESQRDAAQVMEHLMEWSADESNYAYIALQRVIAALSSPASIGYTEYGEVYRTVKTEKGEDGKWIEKKIIDQAYPCFHDFVVPVDQFYIENFYEPDVQKQGWVILRRVFSYSIAQGKYNGVYENFKYVRPGVQTIYDDANRGFYYVYDANMRQEDVEEIIYWNRTLDVKIILVNGVMMTEPDNPNPRQDKLYPFDIFGYEIINSKCFYYKSLAFKLQHDADIVNNLYQMVIDGTYLSIFKPMVAVGDEIIASDVIVPGAVTTLTAPNSDLRAINVGSDLKSGFESLKMVEDSINESSQEPIQQGQEAPSGTTAYEISRLEQNANTVLGLFLQMIAKHVKDFGKLRLGDIIQYLTLAEIEDIEGDPQMVYKTFLSNSGKGSGKAAGRKIQFDAELPDETNDEEDLSKSYDILEEENNEGDEVAIYKINPMLFRELKYMVTVSPDILNPRSDDLERAYNLETYDRLIQNPLTDQEEALRLLLDTNPSTKRDPDKFIKEQQQPIQGQLPPQQGQPQGQSPAQGAMAQSPVKNPLAALQLK